MGLFLFSPHTILWLLLPNGIAWWYHATFHLLLYMIEFSTLLKLFQQPQHYQTCHALIYTHGIGALATAGMCLAVLVPRTLRFGWGWADWTLPSICACIGLVMGTAGLARRIFDWFVIVVVVKEPTHTSRPSTQETMPTEDNPQTATDNVD